MTKDTSGGEYVNGNLFSVTLVIDQLLHKVPGGIGVYGFGLLNGLKEIAANRQSETKGMDDEYLYPGRLSLLSSKRRHNEDYQDDMLSIFLNSVGIGQNSSSSADAVFFSEEKYGSSLLFILAARFGLIKVATSDLLACISLVVPKSKGPTSITIHDLAFRDLPESFTKHGVKWHEAALKRALQRGNGFIVPTIEMAERIRAMAPPGKPIAVIEYGCDHLLSPDIAKAATLLEKEGISGIGREKKLLLAVGTIEPRKNLERLIKAFSLAKNSLSSDVSLLVVGPRGWGEELPELPKGVHLVGSLPGEVLSGLYHLADGLVYVPILEGYGLPVAEAFRSGLPVVSSKVPSAKDATWLVDPFDVSDIAAGIVELLENVDLRASLIAKGYDIAKELTWSNIAFQHLLFWRYIYETYLPRQRGISVQMPKMETEKLEGDYFQIVFREKNIQHAVKVLG